MEALDYCPLCASVLGRWNLKNSLIAKIEKEPPLSYHVVHFHNPVLLLQKLVSFFFSFKQCLTSNPHYILSVCALCGVQIQSLRSSSSPKKAPQELARMRAVYLWVPLSCSKHVGTAKIISSLHLLYINALQNLIIRFHLGKSKLFSVNEADHYFSIC